METLKLNFGTRGCFHFSVAATQNNYNDLLKIVVEEDSKDSYLVHVMGADTLESVFPVFKAVDSACCFKFEHGQKESNYIRVLKGGQISSFTVDKVVYGIEILNEKKEKYFEENGGHNLKQLKVSFGAFKEVEQTTSLSRDVTDDGCYSTDGCSTDGFTRKSATVALNNSSTDKYRSAEFNLPVMHKRTLKFCFESKSDNTMKDNLYLKE
jgi:hypothetical protein